MARSTIKTPVQVPKGGSGSGSQAPRGSGRSPITTPVQTPKGGSGSGSQAPRGRGGRTKIISPNK